MSDIEVGTANEEDALQHSDLNLTTLLLLITAEAAEIQSLNEKGLGNTSLVNRKAGTLRSYVQDVLIHCSDMIRQEDCEHESEVKVGSDMHFLYFRCPDCGQLTQEDR